MVYGFVRQSGGQVRIYSELGDGTTMCLYLPRHVGERRARGRPARVAGRREAGDGEAVLVIEDEASDPDADRRGARGAGYRVIGGRRRAGGADACCSRTRASTC